MNKVSIAHIQKAIVVVAVIYVIMPDLFFGPIDDAAVAGIATITEIVLGIIKSHCIEESDVTWQE